MRTICVFAGSNGGARQEYQQAARELGRELATRSLTLIYGGASVGLMGTLADSVLAAGGEVAHRGLTELREVDSMHERKALMADLADGFVALPGGLGTFDELFEITTWAQIGLHSKPIGLLNVAHYFDPLFALVDHATNEGFIPPSHAHLLHAFDAASALLDSFATFSSSSEQPKWMERPPEP